MFITFEGIDGVGKSTQARLLTARLNLDDHLTILTHEPGGTPFGMKVRELIKTEADLSTYSQFHLIEAQRDHHVAKVIRPAIWEGNIVVCDRFIDTSYVYQNSYMSEIKWHHYLTDYRVIPDITFLMYTNDIPSIKNRMNQRAGIEMDHFDHASVEKLNQMQELFFSLSDRYSRIAPINTDRSIETIAEIIYTHVRFALEDAVHPKTS